jgi:hypothetical protein
MPTPSVLIVPNRLKAGILYSQLPANGDVDFDVTRATTAYRTNASGILESVASGVPRLDYPIGGGCPSLLVEPAATNSLRNNSMQGAVTGTPGTLPTNWTIPAAAGLTREIVAIGTENGVEYIDVKLSGTAIGTETEIRLESATQIVAANGQTWTESVYLKAISQPSPPSNYRLFMIERTSGGTTVATGLSSNLSITTTLTRFPFTRTLSGGVTTERIQPSIFISLTNGASYDFTIRIGWPQMELGSVATSPIRTTSAAATRNADVISNTAVSGLIGQTAGTLYAELDATNFVQFGRYLTIHDGTTNNSIELRSDPSKQLQATIISSGVTVFNVVRSGAPLLNGQNKLALAYDLNNVAFYVNGTLVGSSTSVVPTSVTLSSINIGSRASGGSSMNDRIRAAAIYPIRLTNAQLASLTTL